MNSFIKLIAVVIIGLSVNTALAHEGKHPKLRIIVDNLSTGERIKRGETLTELSYFQVNVKTNGVDCAGQWVVTALGAPDAPPSVLVSNVPFIVGPAVGSNVATGEMLATSIKNTYKISASCNGARKKQRSFAFFEFFSDVAD